MTEQRPYPGTPHWVKLFGIGALIGLVLFVALHLSGHGFGEHAPMAIMQHEAS